MKTILIIVLVFIIGLTVYGLHKQDEALKARQISIDTVPDPFIDERQGILMSDVLAAEFVIRFGAGYQNKYGIVDMESLSRDSYSFAAWMLTQRAHK